MLRKEKQLNGYLLSFLLCALMAALLFLPFLLVDKGFFLYAGDYNSQQIPFYTYAQSVVKAGQMGWSWVSDLGGSFINSFSFYLAGSPFFWLTTLFPTRMVPYLMVPLFVLKFGVAGVTSYAFLKRYSKSRNFAIFGAVLYTFSGFSIYNIFFNHFIDVIALFPLMLWAMDEFIYEKRRGIFALTVALNLLNSYFFFVGQVVFLIIYFLVKFFSKEYRLSAAEFFLLVFEAVVGCFMGIILAIPAMLNLIQNPRTLDTATGFGLLTYKKVQQYFAIFASAFFPPDPPYLPNMFTDLTIKWTSLSAYLPLVSFSGVIAFFKTKKKSALRYLLIIFIIMAFVPVLNSSFYAFNWSYYARWFYMPILLLALATMRVVQDEENNELLKKSIKITAVITGLFALIGITPKISQANTWGIGLAQDAARFWLTFFTALLGLLLFYLVVTQRKTKNRFSARLLGAVMSFTMLFGIIHISLTKFPQWENDANYKSFTYDAAATFDLNDDTFYRIDVYDGYDNIGLHLNIPTIRFFGSVVTPSIMEFYPSVGVKRDVSSKPDLSRYALRGLLSVKYLITEPQNVVTLQEQNNLYGFFYSQDDSGYAILENVNYVPMGFTYDYYINDDDYETVPVDNRSNILMRAINLSDAQIEKYSSVLTKLPASQMGNISFASYEVDCHNRKISSAYFFETNSQGFVADIQMRQDNLVFFSVPYDKGFTAYVNGNVTPIENVSGGLCAVFAPAGDNHIEFIYQTPGLALSKWLTLAGWSIWVAYVFILLLQKRKKRLNPIQSIAVQTKAVPPPSENENP